MRLPPSSLTPHCPFLDIELNGRGYGTVLLQNPKGCPLVSANDAKALALKLL